MSRRALRGKSLRKQTKKSMYITNNSTYAHSMKLTVTESPVLLLLLLLLFRLRRNLVRDAEVLDAVAAHVALG
jgi:hypothetical protein